MKTFHHLTISPSYNLPLHNFVEIFVACSEYSSYFSNYNPEKIHPMRNIFFQIFFVLVLMSQLSSCTREDPGDAPTIPPPKVGLISGVGGFNDRGFNQLALQGLLNITQSHGLTSTYLESHDTSDFAVNIDSLIHKGYNLIILLGYEAAGAVKAAASANPSVHFVLLDYNDTDIPSNVVYCFFQVDQSAFLCGFLGAYWADLKDQAGPVASWIGGMDIPVIEQFRAGYEGGIKFFNDKYHKSVGTSGFFADSFNDTLQGANLADTLIMHGADVIFPFAGKTGNGALYKILEKGKWGIGVDFDQYLSIPEVSGILLTSCLKKMDNAVYNIINYVEKNGFVGKKIYYGNLSTVDIEIAPFHDYDALIPDSINTELNTIRTGIKNGSILTGWSL
jgi:basic membrane protein A and related proteins